MTNGSVSEARIKPTTGSERLVVLDALRGFALFEILFANLYSFMGFNTLTPDERLLLPALDRGMLFFIDARLDRVGEATQNERTSSHPGDACRLDKAHVLFQSSGT